ncbi:carcinine transporter-like, partial [Limulus polyphemus]|uniref:Carcinine transporter-like n=1 Tax=Limulus polyphemus TaxID=6850 RepID=A0ABM1BLN1_LIMPO
NEIVGKKHRSFIPLLASIGNGVGHVMLGGLGFFIKDWRILAVVTAVPVLVHSVCLWILPESPRFLLSRGRVPEAMEVFEKIATTNKMELFPEIALHERFAEIFLILQDYLWREDTGEEAKESLLICYLIGKMMASGTANFFSAYAVELFPTSLRGRGIGLCMNLAMLSNIFVPFIDHLGHEYHFLPLVILGVCMTFGGILILALPETRNCRLPETVEEAEDFAKNWTWRDYLRCTDRSI